MVKKSIKPNWSNITHRWVDLLAPFSDNYSTKLSASELSIENKAKRFVQEIRTSVHKIRTEEAKNKDS